MSYLFFDYRRFFLITKITYFTYLKNNLLDIQTIFNSFPVVCTIMNKTNLLFKIMYTRTTKLKHIILKQIHNNNRRSLQSESKLRNENNSNLF